MEKAGTDNEVTITKVQIKKENPNDDIKDFTEKTMTELLGWYGLENTRDDMKIAINCRSHNRSNGNGIESPKSSDECGWCGKQIEENTGLTSASTSYCSELCFSQSRRANFKKNKTCDWCRHVRHTVSYVDFQDGASQLQFCSDKCLNQYKMHIFCRETRAHLELHPHLQVETSSSGTLITPELWLKNCKSPEPRSPSPTSPKSFEQPSFEKLPQTSPLPLISVAHPSKLMDNVESKKNRLRAQKKTKKRLPATITYNSFIRSPPSDAPQDLRVRHSPTDLTQNNVSGEESEQEKIEHFFKPSSAVPPLNARIPTPQQFVSPDLEPPRRPFENLLPPPTIIVPYPIFLPLPLPVPIPVPIPIKKEEAKETKDVCLQTDSTPVEANNNNINIEVGEVVNGVVNVVEDKKAEPKTVCRLLRKRKRVCEPKMTNMKTRRVLSNSTN